MNNIRPLRSYRAHLLPQHIHAADVHDLADQGLLPTVRLKAGSATHAEALAHLATGRQVLRVERVEAA